VAQSDHHRSLCLIFGSETTALWEPRSLSPFSFKSNDLEMVQAYKYLECGSQQMATILRLSKPNYLGIKVKELFDKAGMSFAFTNQDCGQEIMEKLMSRYRDQFIHL